MKETLGNPMRTTIILNAFYYIGASRFRHLRVIS